MSMLKTKNQEEENKKSYVKFLLPAYIVLSALFIIYASYSYFTGVVYNS